ncbi:MULTISPECIES: hypothetical protein [Streptomyces]|uniref:hypothetical protein n=1 Tax=Streptomyces TaxID=1883 RepID=UPI000F774924|nr:MULTISPECIES: hypothetical protein [Streptomyces]RSS99381.1 hypothetical protein EF910_35725 [Streptomyces sp. WAC07149]GLX17201.1 hypothetical protein Slala01_08450 [Streptomyces lavendulae subsp. lavendulae]GLX24940.1 hypothetical protein Slala02_07600 [Streptomyces lavendulae subsp. lavendulae]
MSSPTQLPDYGEVLAEVREVRRAGIVRLRELRLPLLTGMSAGPGAGGPGEPHFPAVERLLRAAVTAMGGGTLQEAAEYSLGLARGTRDWPPADRRRRAAQVYGVSVERFRKHQELMVLGQVAEQLVRRAAAGSLPPDGAADPPPSPGPARQLAPSHRRITVRAGGRAHALTLHVHPVDLLRDIDAVVSPSNTHFALPEPYKSSVAASLRRAGAVRDPAGRIVEDRIRDELRAWTDRYAPHGLPVAPGTVAVTGAGALEAQGVRHIHHAAVAVPRPGTNDYDVLPSDVTRAVTRVFALLAGGPARPSVCLPLLGAGRGGLAPADSLAAVWAAVEAELARGGDHDVHLLVRRPERADLVEELLTAPDGLPA